MEQRASIFKLNNRGSAIMQTLVVAFMVATLSASLTKLNVGQGRANLQALKKQSASNLAQIVSMHLADENLCTQMIQVNQAITPGNHGADGIAVQIRMNYPTWADGTAGFKNVPVNNNPDDNQVGDSNIYFKEIRVVLPLDGNGAFDEANAASYALPDGAGGYRPIMKYQGQIVVELADNSPLPIPIAPVTLNFIINVDTTDDSFESCSANRGVTEYCEQLGCDWETTRTLADGTQVDRDPLDPDPNNWPRCVCGPGDVAPCTPDPATGQPRYIADFTETSPGVFAPDCRTFFLDCSDPNNFSNVAETDPASPYFPQSPRDFNCSGNPLTCPGWFMNGFDPDGNVLCEPAGTNVTVFTDCPAQRVSWSDGTWICHQNTGQIPDGAFRTLTLNDTYRVGTARFQCRSGQLYLEPPGNQTCTNPVTYNWYVGPWVPATCSGSTTPSPTSATPTSSGGVWQCDSAGEVGNSCNTAQTGVNQPSCTIGDSRPFAGGVWSPNANTYYPGQLTGGGIHDPINLRCRSMAQCSAVSPGQCDDGT